LRPANHQSPITDFHSYCELDFGVLCFNNACVARVVIKHLTKVFPGPKGENIRAVDDFNLTAEDKELLVLTGPSGCGKTTTLRLIAGLEEATGGSISIGDRPMKNVPPGERSIAMVFQNHALYPHMSAYENMAFSLKVRHLPRLEIEKRIKEAAEMLDLVNCLQRKPKELSGGQRQRVALGRAIVRRPEVFLFDEPLSNLDAPMRVQMRTEISKLHKYLGATTIYVTHDQVEAMTLGERIVVMNRGVLQQIDEPMSVYEHPANLFVAGFIGSPRMNFFEALVVHKGNRLFLEEQNAGDGEVPGPRFSLKLEDAIAASLKDHVGKKIVFGIRPEKIGSTPEAMGINGQNVEAVVEVVEPIGAERFVCFGVGKQSFVARVSRAQHVRVNEKVALTFDMSGGHFFDPETGKAMVQ
jgi:multiple sugar transport system ATP-binding protein